MKVKIYFIAALMFACLATAFAQAPNGQQPRMNPEEMAKGLTDRMTTEIKLNDKQKTEISAINLKYTKKTMEIFQANQGNWEVIRTKMEESRTLKNNEVKAVLTDEQYKLYEEFMKKWMEEGRKRRMEQSNQGH
jgi:periplasmic protein CpxP/Spy